MPSGISLQLGEIMQVWGAEVLHALRPHQATYIAT
jgi:hypothetical protein